MRTLIVVVVLALFCRWGVAQIGPRYVIELRSQGSATAGMAQGKVQLAGKGLALIRFQGLRVLAVDADGAAYSKDAVAGWPAADLLLVLPADAGRYQGLAPLRTLRSGAPVIVAEDELAGVASAGAARLYPMQLWNTLELRKQNTRLRVTAMAGAPGTRGVAGFMLELGNRRSSYRVYLSCRDDEAAALAQRLPGADLAVLPARGAPRLLALNRGAAAQHGPAVPAALTAAGFAFTAIRR